VAAVEEDIADKQIEIAAVFAQDGTLLFRKAGGYAAGEWPAFLEDTQRRSS
jgi:hypothetical protein